MGKKTTRQKIAKPTPQKLETRFDCPLCNHENVVQCKVVSKSKRGIAFCSVCESYYGSEVTSLDKPIDIYYKWIDELNSKKDEDNERLSLSKSRSC